MWQTLGPRQIWPICRVSNYEHLAKRAFLPCVKEGTLGIVTPFAVCQSMGTRQRPFQNPQNLASLPSVIGQTLGKDAILVPECTEFCHVSTLPSVLHLALGKRPLCRVLHSAKLPQIISLLGSVTATYHIQINITSITDNSQ